MKIRRLPLCIGAALCCSIPVVAAAEPEPWNRAGLWRLTADAAFEEGCFEPCTCPVHYSDDLRGSFVLTLIGIGDVTDFYSINQLVLTLPQLQRVYAGEGQFRFSIWTHQESISAEIGNVLTGAPPQHFEGSATVPADPDTMDITITRNNRVCHDTVFRIAAARCRTDWDRSGAITPADVAAFVSDWVRSVQQNTQAADYNGNGAIEPADVAQFVGAWFTGVAGGSCS